LLIDDNEIEIVSDSINNLTQLNTISLGNNKLYKFPEINNLQKLTRLYLHINELQEIPISIYGLDQIEELSIGDNNFKKISERIGSLKKLKKLWLSSEFDAGLRSLPLALMNIQNLKYMYLRGNNLLPLSKSILDDLQNPKKILNCYYNKIEEKRKETLEYIKDAEKNNSIELDLSGRELFEIPSEIEMLKQLKALILSDNHLVNIPSNIGKLKNLTVLNLKGNQLSELPEEIQELLNLQVLNLSNNQFSTFPDVFNFKSLTKLTINNNYLLSVPQGIRGLEKLQQLDLSNNLIKSLPYALSELCNLQTIKLNNNPDLPKSVYSLINPEKVIENYIISCSCFSPIDSFLLISKRN